MIYFDHTLHLPDPDGGDHLAIVQCAVNLWDGEVEATEDRRAVELDELQTEEILEEAEQ